MVGLIDLGRGEKGGQRPRRPKRVSGERGKKTIIHDL